MTGAAEIQQSVIVAGRLADEHILKHLLDGSRRPAITDEVGAEFASRPTEGHVVAQDLDLLAVLLDRREDIVCIGCFLGIIRFDVRQLGAADDALLLLRG